MSRNIDPEKANSIPQIKEQFRNVKEVIKENAKNIVIIKSSSNKIDEVIGNFPQYNKINETRFVFDDGTNHIPLSVSYTGSAVFSGGPFIPYASNDIKLVKFSCTGFSAEVLIGQSVSYIDITTNANNTVSQNDLED